MIPIEEHEKRMALYRKGLNDAQIGRECYCTPATITAWRKKHGLPARITKKRVDWAAADLLIYSGAEPKVVAEKVRCDVSTIHRRIRQLRREGWMG